MTKKQQNDKPACSHVAGTRMCSNNFVTLLLQILSFRSTSSHRPTSPATRSSSKNSRTRTGAVRLLATNKKSFFGSPLFFLQTTHTHPQLSCSNPKLRNYWRSVIFCYPGWPYFKCNTFLGVVGKNLMKKYSHTTVLTTLNPLKSNAVTLHIILKGIV